MPGGSKKSISKRAAGVKPAAVLEVKQAAIGAVSEKWIPAVIALFGLVAYYNSLHAPFIFDDRYHIVENARIRQLLPPWPYLLHSSRPVIYLSLALNYAIGRLDPLGYHIFNLAVHISAALVLYGILRRTFRTEALRQQFGTAGGWLAGMIALIWLVHPLQTESVTYTIQRGESLMGLFFLLTLYCVIRSAGGSAHEIGWKVGAIASCVLGMGCKGVIVTAPIIVLLYDRAFLSKSWTELARKRWGLYAGLAATWVLYPLMLARAPEEWKETAGFAYGGVSPMQYAITQPAVILHYLRLVLWPDQLCLDYGWRAAQTAGEVIPEITMILGLIVATIWAWFKKPAWGFPGAWFFVILVPTSSFIPIADLAVEHRMYLSLAAVIALCVIGLFLLFRRKIVIASWCIVAITVLALTGATIERNTAYASLISIWEDTVIKRPHSPRAQYDLADTLEQAGRIQEATEHYRLAVQENPSYTDALNNLGHVLYASGNFAEAETYLQRAVQLKPDLAIAHFNLGYVLAQLGKPQDALSELELAIKLKPDYVEARTNLGIVLAMSGRISGAIDEWEQAIRLDPRAAEAHSNLAFALSQTGEAREAISHYEEAIRLKPDYVNAQVGLARLLATLGPEHGGDPARAVTLASRACELTGYRVASHLDTLALSYAAAGRYDDAVKTETNAEQLALSSGQPELGRQFEANLARYRAYHR